MVLGVNKLVLHGIDMERFASKHGIEPVTHPCQECGRTRTTTLPFVSGSRGEFVGLVAPRCECGHFGTPYCCVGNEKYGDLFEVARQNEYEDARKRKKKSKRKAKVIQFRKGGG